MSNIHLQAKKAPSTPSTPSTQKAVTTDRQSVIPKSSSSTTKSSIQHDIFDDKTNTPFGWNESKSSETVTFAGTHKKSISALVADETKNTEDILTLIDTEPTHDSVHDLTPDMDSAGLWISAVPILKSPNDNPSTPDKTKKLTSNDDISPPQSTAKNYRLHGSVLCISLSIVGLFIYLNPENTYVESSTNISHDVKATYNEALANIEEKSNEIYEKIMLKLNSQKKIIPNTQDSEPKSKELKDNQPKDNDSKEQIETLAPT